MPVKPHPDLANAVASKARLPTLHRLVSNAQLDRHLKKWGGMDMANATSKLTLGTALLARPDIAAGIEEQIRTLEPFVYMGRVASVTKQLLNDTEGLLNTWSELGLAMRLLADGWQVEIGHVFWAQKDVDVKAERNGVVRFIDVINLAPEPFESSLSGFHAMPGSTPLEPKLFAKVKAKSGTKFAAARAAGWTGSAWVALDHGKSHALSIDLSFRRALTGQDWRAALAAQLGAQEGTLDGVIYYQFGAVDFVSAEPIAWSSVSRTS